MVNIRKIKNNIIIGLLFLSSSFLFAQSKLSSIKHQFNIRQISNIKWNGSDGITYEQVPGANLGAVSFAIIDTNRIALLCNSINDIVITNRNTGKTEKRFNVKPAPRDVIYSDKRFYVLFAHSVTQYNEYGKEENDFPFSDKYSGVERIARYNNTTWLLLPSGSSVMIESNGNTVESEVQVGWITNEGLFVSSTREARNSFSIKVTAVNKTFESSYNFNGNVAGVYVIGSQGEKIYLDVQIFISENPITVERYIVSIQMNDQNSGAILSQVKIPDCYYVLTNKDFVISEDGALLNMITSSDGVSILSLSEPDNTFQQNYPGAIWNRDYHFNEHLIAVDDIKENIAPLPDAQITREQIINNAVSYTNYTWTAASCNIWNNVSCGSKSVISAPWIEIGSNISMPYCWGGWSTLQEHNNAMSTCKSAGDVNTSTAYAAGLNCASGFDCSGFVTRAWGLGNKYSTRSLPDISFPINLTQTKPGDILNVANSHVRLITQNYGNGNYQVIEASGIDWKTAYHSYNSAQLALYIPRKYNNVIDEPTSVVNESSAKDFILSQNYPNPFNPTTNFEFRLPAGKAGISVPADGLNSRHGGQVGFVTLRIYDILGNEVAILVNEEKPAGKYEVHFDGSKLASGVYYYQLRVQGLVATRKMILIK